ncbi:MAG TPA: 4-hydroxy-tetrahydrodipicolinate synthase, partial [Pirellulales bacterium]|nr:4-hydroxy-tetrahydrodipicolinate synthase [Pirellulales bacterium]
MSTQGEDFAGLSVALTTPLRHGEVDYLALKAQVEFQIAAGTHGLCPVGTTGESPTLSHEEHERVIAAVVEYAAGRIKVMPGTGSNSTREALRLTSWAAKAGADAALVVAPYYNKPTQEGFYQHFRALAETVGIPICVYNIPGRTGKNIEPETIARMAELPNIALVKEATGSMDQASQILALTDLTVLSGDDSLTLPLLAIGGRGVISVVGNIVPGDVLALLKAFAAGNLSEAQRWHRKMFPLCRDMLGLATNPIPIKAAMRLLGRDTGELRLPMTAL